MSNATIVDLAEDCVEVRVRGSDEAHRLADRLRQDGAYEAVVPGLETVAVRFEPAQTVRDAVIAHIDEAIKRMSRAPEFSEPETITIPVQYGGSEGPDFDTVCEKTGMSADEVIELHCSATYRVDLLGFTPGFAYMSGLPAALKLPRLEVPRVRLPAGSIGVAGGYCGLYAMAGPGGWSILGRTDAVLFDPNARDPFRINPGTMIRFVPK